ncbi:LuxR family transcriptional regulator [Longispora fulva]|uniref:DNA-binding CsgD family transcriptional regulator/tetratricopeptide (TPR) repeat protein n=1 Tax=Longispora fulva TaxID=619741 RepID=A0A8J7GF22_9ACTN|nr:LuxR family transcriptional regulator [Longispora fulva]MBG6136556.1 DNA-binding CsgD family transcriptional regulator/tetratricopeptide (TPR) repeat protein [Longispora fulva]GIG59726.1 LuxR family transcriptional regulator [Longispora fulva]
MNTTILEREAELATLATAAREAGTGSGSVLLVSGEAGIGKSSLIHGIRSVLPAAGRLLVGYCDDLATPRVLGPLRDLIGSVGTALTRALERGDRAEVLETLRAELDRERQPTVLAVEDVHWADEATLDVLRYLIRRAARLPLVLVLTYRDDELVDDHPLRQLLGVASRAERVRRLRLSRLSLAAVRQLSEASAVDADEVFAVTAGNPYFVTELLAGGDAAAVPLTIADAVSARVAQLDPASAAVLERLAVVPSAVERWLVDALEPDSLALLAPAEQRGLLRVTPRRVGFRHELTRRAVVDSMPAARREAANRGVLAALLARPGIEVSRVVHHAAQAGARDVILEYGPAAAREAADAGAHRQAVAHLRLVLDQQPVLDPPDEAELWERLAVESYTIGAPSEETVAAQRRAVELWRGTDPLALGAALRWLSRICWWAGSPDQANAAADEAVVVLEAAGDDQLLAMALSGKAQLHALAGRAAEAADLAQRAIVLGRDNPAIRSHALNNLAMAQDVLGDPTTLTTFEESLRVALDADEPEHACRAYVNLALVSLARLRLDVARRLLPEGVEFAERSEFLMYFQYLQVAAASLHFMTGDWDEVSPAAEHAFDASPPVRCAALTVFGRAQLRRGDPAAVGTLREAWRMGIGLGESQWVTPAAAALAEAGTLDPGADPALEELTEAYELAGRFGTVAERAELAYWLGRAGRTVGRGGLEHPYALLADGRWAEAAEAWRTAGCRYEYAMALATSPEPDDQLTALAVLDALGARPLARLVRARLRDLGTRVPRGPAASTRGNPAGLTERQLEVVRLLAQGTSNVEIARLLVVSVRTVESHVAAVLTKLGARTRQAAAERAADLGLLKLR